MSGISKRLILSVFIATILVGVILITFRVVKMTSVFCKYSDPYLCSFVSNVSAGNLKKLQGDYIESHQNIQVYQAEWKLSGNDQEMLYKDDVSEQMHVIMVDDKVYLKDYADGRWWEQPIDKMQEYETKLPFEPSVFIGNLKSSIENSNLYIIQEDVCGADNCRKYALNLQDNEMKRIFIFLSEQDRSLKKVQVQKENLIQELRIHNVKPQIEKPTHDIKIAKAGENIFVENFLQRTQQSKKTPDYVKEFEQIRLQEEDGQSIDLPEYAVEQASSSAF